MRDDALWSLRSDLNRVRRGGPANWREHATLHDLLLIRDIPRLNRHGSLLVVPVEIVIVIDDRECLFALIVSRLAEARQRLHALFLLIWFRFPATASSVLEEVVPLVFQVHSILIFLLPRLSWHGHSVLKHVQTVEVLANWLDFSVGRWQAKTLLTVELSRICVLVKRRGFFETVFDLKDGVFHRVKSAISLQILNFKYFFLLDRIRSFSHACRLLCPEKLPRAERLIGLPVLGVSQGLPDRSCCLISMPSRRHLSGFKLNFLMLDWLPSVIFILLHDHFFHENHAVIYSNRFSLCPRFSQDAR